MQAIFQAGVKVCLLYNVPTAGIHTSSLDEDLVQPARGMSEERVKATLLVDVGSHIGEECVVTPLRHVDLDLDIVHNFPAVEIVTCKCGA